MTIDEPFASVSSGTELKTAGNMQARAPQPILCFLY